MKALAIILMVAGAFVYILPSIYVYFDPYALHSGLAGVAQGGLLLAVQGVGAVLAATGVILILLEIYSKRSKAGGDKK